MQFSVELWTIFTYINTHTGYQYWIFFYLHIVPRWNSEPGLSPCFLSLLSKYKQTLKDGICRNMKATQPSLDVCTCWLTPVNGVGSLVADDLTWCYAIVALGETRVRRNQIAQKGFWLCAVSFYWWKQVAWSSPET